MDTHGFKFTFYLQPFEPKSENLCECAQVKTTTSRKLIQNRPILGQIQNSNTNLRTNRPRTQRNTRVLLTNPRSESRKEKVNTTEMLRSKSYLNNLHAVDTTENLLQKRNPKSCNAIRLFPVLHHYKRPPHQCDLFVSSLRLRPPSQACSSIKPILNL